MKLPSLLPILALIFVIQPSFAAPEFSEEQRLQGFAEHQRKNTKFSEERERFAEEVAKKRQQWEDEIEKSVDDYKAWKARQAKRVDENSPEYEQDRQMKRNVEQQLEDFRVDYVQRRDLKLRAKNNNVKLTEEQEYGLDEPVLRADIKKRVLYGAKSPWTKGPVTSGGGGGSSPAPNLGGDYTPPPAPPPTDFGGPPSGGPEYYEPDIPPPPPPPPDPGGFDEPIPPPIFDDPEF